MSTAFGTYDKSSGGVDMDPGMYDAIIESASLVYENGVPKESQNGKNLVKVAVRIDRETVLNRTMSISFGQNKANGQWAVFAKFIEAATGIKCGDKTQRNVTEDELRGKRVRIVVEQNDNGYMDITSFMPPGKSSARPQPAPAVSNDDEPFFDEYGNRI